MPKTLALRAALTTTVLFGTAGLALIAAPTPAGAGVAPGTITLVAGNGTAGHTGDNGPAIQAELNRPEDVIQDPSGNLYIADNLNCEVRMVTPSGTISTIAGNGTCGTETGIPGPATSARFGNIKGLAIDSSGNIYITDYPNHRVLVLSPAGTLSVFAGNGTSGNTGNGAQATAAELVSPWGVRVDRSGDVFISDGGAHVVRMVAPNGVISTVAGNGTSGATGDNGPATAAELEDPAGLSVDQSGNLFIADELAAVVRKVSPAGIITTVAGNGTPGATGNGGPATSAELSTPYGVATDISGNIYIANWTGQTIQKVDHATGNISTIAGNGTMADTGNNGPAVNAEVSGPSELWYDNSGNLLVNDYNGNTIREIALVQPTGQGYTIVSAKGGAFSFGQSISTAPFMMGPGPLNKPIVGIAMTPDDRGYWMDATDGGVFTEGDAAFYGSAGAIHLNKPVVGMATTPDGKGYWLVASDGGIFSYGDALFHGSTGSIHLNQPIVGMATTPTGNGYWLVASDGGIFAFGDAVFHGSTGAIHLNKPVVGMAATPDGKGYWLVASDGGIFSFGDALFYGSTGAIHLNQPIVGMTATPDGKGYWFVAADGGVFTEGDATFFGALATYCSQLTVQLGACATAVSGAGPVVGIAAGL